MQDKQELLKERVCYELEMLKLELLQPGSDYSLSDDKELYIVDYVDNTIKKIIMMALDLNTDKQGIGPEYCNPLMYT